LGGSEDSQRLCGCLSVCAPGSLFAACAYGLVVLPSNAVAEPAAAGSSLGQCQHSTRRCLGQRVALLAAELSLDGQQQARCAGSSKDQREQVMKSLE